ncbi:MAG: hypothetical protein HOV96_19530 [Nonomuraea sp.]|nr:hypothetical protein [Nonomuraea sp.]
MTSRPRSNRAKPQPPAPAPIPEAEVVLPRSPLFLDPEPAELGITEEHTTPPVEVNPPWSNSDPSSPAAAPDSPFGTPSTADPSAKKADPPRRITRASVRKYAGIAVAMVLGYVADTLTKPDSIERHAGMWQPDDEDLTDMADPVAGLVARRIPQSAGKVINPDVEDGLVLALALTKYLGKQWQRRQAIKAALAAQPVDLTAGDVEAVPA